MKAYGEVDVQIHIFLTSALVGGEESASRHRPLQYPLDKRLGRPQNQSERHGEEKILAPTGTQSPTPRSSTLQPAAIPTVLSQCIYCSSTHIKWILRQKQEKVKVGRGGEKMETF
jgi:hypothetical protein